MATRSIRRPALVVPLVAGLLALSGCLKSEESTKVGSDGKGKSTITMTFDLAKVEAAKEMMEGMGMGGAQGNQGDPLKDLAPDALRKKIEGAKGVKIVSVNSKHDPERKTMTAAIVLEFDSLEALYKSGMVERVDVKLEKLADGNYKFSRKVGGDMAPDAGDNPEAAAMVEGMLSMFQPFLESMEMAFEIMLPTAVVETNGATVGENKVRWSVGFKDLTNAKKRDQHVVFDGEGLAWKPFAVTAAEIQAQKEKRKAAQTTPSEPDSPKQPEKEPADEGEGE